ncbi:hypothetical protein MFRU_038g00730 [Monilinia fructicola]|nr:hypothetical protein MFRU_038g00730 [Monilinia fructicola]
MRTHYTSENSNSKLFLHHGSMLNLRHFCPSQCPKYSPSPLYTVASRTAPKQPLGHHFSGIHLVPQAPQFQ